MAARASGIEIPLRVRPDSSIQRSLRGVTQSARKATAQEMAEAKRAAVQKQRAQAQADRMREQSAMRGLRLQASMAARGAKDAKRLADEQIKQEARSARERKRQVEQLERYKIKVQRESLRMHERTMRAEVREAQKAHREMARTESQRRQTRRRVLATVGGGIVGGTMAAANAAAGFASNASSRVGVATPGDTIMSAKDITENMIRSLAAAGYSRSETKSTIQRIDEVAKEKNVDQAQLASAVTMGQERFSDPRTVEALLPTIAEISRAYGADATDVAGLAMTIKQAGTANGQEITTDDLRDILLSVASQTGEGSIEFSSLSGEFASSIATAAQDLGAAGKEQMLQLTAIAQLLGKSLKDPAEVSTLMERLTGRLKLGDVQKRLSKLGINIADKEGRITSSPAEIMSKLFASDALKNPQIRQAVFKDLLGEQGLATIMTALQKDPMAFERLALASPEAGQAQITEINSRLDDSPFAKIDAMNIQAQSVTLQGGELVDTFIKAAEIQNKIATEHPMAYEAAGPIFQTLAGLGAGGLLGSLFGKLGFGGAATATAGTASTAAAGETAATVGVGGRLMAAGAPLMLTPAAIPVALLAGLTALGSSDTASSWIGGKLMSATGADKWQPDPHSFFAPKLEPPMTRVLPADAAQGGDLGPTIEAAIARGMGAGKATLRLEVIDGKARVLGTKRTDDFPIYLDTGSLTSKM